MNPVGKVGRVDHVETLGLPALFHRLVHVGGHLLFLELANRNCALS